ncbi:hypothetical protein NIES4102_20740 [Chondrocystis sp. NIES-4102]|nr:hypothetical protein NIES4102_20740 [Chondrocystis sp. NIES-4102]
MTTYDLDISNSPLNSPQTLPLVSIDLIAKVNAPILIVAPHPDDETLGCGGLIALLRQLHLTVEVLIVSDGTQSHPNSLKYPAPVLKELRACESLAALGILGVDSTAVTFLGLPDGGVENSRQSPEAIAACDDYLKRIQPSLIFLPWRQDPHPDHRASWQLLKLCSSNLLHQPRIIEYPIWDWDHKQRQEFTASVSAWRLDISDVLELKKKAIARYLSQISDLIDDDPQGFRLSVEMIANFTQPWEIYLELS